MLGAKSETVIVYDREKTGVDSLNNDVFTETPVEVPGVLVVPGSAENVIDSMRPDGIMVSYTLYFPKSFTGEVDRKRIDVRGRACRAIGHSDRYKGSPNGWNMVVYVGAVDG